MTPDTSFQRSPRRAGVAPVQRPAAGRSLLPISFLLVAVSTVAAASVQPGIVKQQFICEHGPTPISHASTIVETGDGLLAAWFGGPEARHSSNTIFAARHVRGKWSDPRQITDGMQPDGRTRYQCWNPVLFQRARGPLLLFYKVGPSPEKWWGMLMSSTNDGHTWSKPRPLPDGFVGPVRNKPVELADGSLLCGASTEDGGWAVHMERCFDSGERWEKTALLENRHSWQAIQPTILVHDARRLQALCRTRNGFIAQTMSTNGGRAWGELKPTALPNPNSAIDAVRLKDGAFLLVYNHSSSNRCEFSVAMSRDGEQWRSGLIPEPDAGEFAYPAIIQSRDGFVHLTYSWNKQRIRHVIIDPARVAFPQAISSRQ